MARAVMVGVRSSRLSLLVAGALIVCSAGWSCSRRAEESTVAVPRQPVASGSAADRADRSPERNGESERKTYRLGFAPADPDAVEAAAFLDGGSYSPCQRLNALLASPCCDVHEIGCQVRYTCERLEVDPGDLMTDTPHSYRRYRGALQRPHYELHHGGPLRAVFRYLRVLQLYGRAEGVLPIGYTRHPLLLDDEETKIASNKIDPADPSLRLLGELLPGLSQRRGRQILLDYYSSTDGILLSIRPTNQENLALALAEYRGVRFSFDGKQLTDTGARHLFTSTDGDILPNPSGCLALAETEPSYFRFFL